MEKLVQDNRITVSMEVRTSNGKEMLCISLNVPEGKNHIEFLDNARNELQLYADKLKVEQVIKTVFDDKKSNTGKKCKKCGADIILNPKTNKEFCKEK